MEKKKKKALVHVPQNGLVLDISYPISKEWHNFMFYHPLHNTAYKGILVSKELAFFTLSSIKLFEIIQLFHIYFPSMAPTAVELESKPFTTVNITQLTGDECAEALKVVRKERPLDAFFYGRHQLSGDQTKPVKQIRNHKFVTGRYFYLILYTRTVN